MLFLCASLANIGIPTATAVTTAKKTLTAHFCNCCRNCCRFSCSCCHYLHSDAHASEGARATGHPCSRGQPREALPLRPFPAAPAAAPLSQTRCLQTWTQPPRAPLPCPRGRSPRRTICIGDTHSESAEDEGDEGYMIHPDPLLSNVKTRWECD